MKELPSQTGWSRSGSGELPITAAAISTSWKDHQINIIDTPGHVDFTIEVERSMRVLDGVIAVFCSVAGVQPQSETVWRQAERYKVPRIAFINKMDRTGANFYKVHEQIRDRLRANAIAIQLPIGSENDFQGIVDLVRQRAYIYANDQGTDIQETDIPEELQAQVDEFRTKLIEAAAETDDALMAKYFEVKNLQQEIRTALRKGTIAGTIVPVLCGSAFKNKGVQLMLDAVVDYLPAPSEVPPIQGLLPNGDTIERRADDNEPQQLWHSRLWLTLTVA